MSNSILLTHPTCNVSGSIHLYGSKSISNRVLIIQALSGEDFLIENISQSDDTKTLQQLLASNGPELDAHHAGTTYRFMTALLATKTDKEVILTGSSRMKERPIGPLVDALRNIGAQITYIENEGYPPLKIESIRSSSTNKITIAGDISSQYITALLLIAPTLEYGLEIEIKGELVSRPYVEMTLSIMKYFGVDHHWQEQQITIYPQRYISRNIYIEGDWSSASYYFSMAALAHDADIEISGLQEESLQADRAIADIAKHFNVNTIFKDQKVRLIKKSGSVDNAFNYDFIKCPDIAQTVAVMCAGTGVKGVFSGLKTLKIKETDRIAALQNELIKLGVTFSLENELDENADNEHYIISGQAKQMNQVPSIETYSDHRMAMSFAPLCLMLPSIIIEDHMVVSKSYPSFWEDMKKLAIKMDTV